MVHVNLGAPYTFTNNGIRPNLRLVGPFVAKVPSEAAPLCLALTDIIGVGDHAWGGGIGGHSNIFFCRLCCLGVKGFALGTDRTKAWFRYLLEGTDGDDFVPPPKRNQSRSHHRLCLETLTFRIRFPCTRLAQYNGRGVRVG